MNFLRVMIRSNLIKEERLVSVQRLFVTASSLYQFFADKLSWAKLK